MGEKREGEKRRKSLESGKARGGWDKVKSYDRRKLISTKRANSS